MNREDLVKLAPSAFKVDPTVQQRADGLYESWVEELAAVLREGGEFRDPVVAFEDANGVIWLAGGFHRHAAAVKAEAAYLHVDLRNGDRRDALAYAVSDNADHGRPRTAADKRKAVMTCLNDPLWKKLPDREIDRTCRVSTGYTSRLRKELTGAKPDAAKSAGAKKGNEARAAEKEPTVKAVGADRPHPEPKTDATGRELPEHLKPVFANPVDGADRPHAVCPGCGGDGDAGRCPTCSGEGWIGKEATSKLPETLKKKIAYEAAEDATAREVASHVARVESLCKSIDANVATAEELGKSRCGWSLMLNGILTQLRSARSSLWAGRLSEECPYCAGKPFPCGEKDGCRGLRRLRSGDAKRGRDAKHARGDAA